MVCFSEIPAWYKSALFNELYYLCDGGTVWLDPRDKGKGNSRDTDKMHAHIKEYSKFAYLEGNDFVSRVLCDTIAFLSIIVHTFTTLAKDVYDIILSHLVWINDENF